MSELSGIRISLERPCFCTHCPEWVHVLGNVWQHGENPEHALPLEPARTFAQAHVRVHELADWLDRVHGRPCLDCRLVLAESHLAQVVRATLDQGDDDEALVCSSCFQLGRQVYEAMR